VAGKYYLFNGSLVPRESWNSSPEEWIRNSGLVIETHFFASGNRIPLLAESLRLLDQRFQSVGWHIPDSLKMNDLLPNLEKLLNRNRNFKGCMIHMAVMPVASASGFDGNTGFNYLAVTEEMEFDFFPLNIKGLAIGISAGFRNTGEPFYSSIVRSPIRTLLIREEYLNNGWDDSLLLDHKGFLSEASTGNLFIRTGDRILTPGPENNCFPRVMTSLVRDLALKKGFRIDVLKNLVPEHLKNAEEVFITDDINGIRWVLSYENKRYYRKVSAQLSDELRNYLQNPGQFQSGSSG
jgi:branched-chain amino acid aminotransferase